MEMDPVPGYEMANWEGGYGDFSIVPDMATLRRIPWLDRTALVLCDVANHDGSPVVASPRQVLIAQYERAAEMGYTPMAATELEFYLYKESYAEAHEKDFSGLTPTIPYILDYHILATTMDEQYLGPIRRGMHEAGIPVEFSKGEAWYGQHEVNIRYADAVTAADRHTIYKNGVKEIAFLNEISASFMAKPSEKDIGSSCHVHISLSATTARASSSTATRRPTSSATSSAASAPTSASWRCSSPPRSTPTSATRPRAGPRPRSPGAATTAPAASASSATEPRGGSSAGSPAPT